MQESTLLDVYIEIPQGGYVRQEPGKKAVPYAGTPANVPALAFVSYGCLPEIKNPADGEDVDVFVLGTDKAPLASTVKAKLIGIRQRLNGDHKLLTVATDSAVWSSIKDVSEIDPDILKILGRYVEKTERDGESWRSAHDAAMWLAMIKLQSS